ncbi:MAG: VWA domain-containing protein [Victivallaceae bacterium]|nr:VWA domain-containing protein [Victivallaceae bacterium]
MFEFAYPKLLWLLTLLPLLYFYLVFFKRNPGIQLPSVAPFERAVRHAGRRRMAYTELLFLLALGVLIFALSRPRRGDERTIHRSKGIDIVLALDLSGSMAIIDLPAKDLTARDLEELFRGGKLDNRLETAKRELTNFVNRRDNDRFGLIGFGPLAYSITPPTLDHGFLTGRLAELQPGAVGDATSIASPILSGARRLSKSPSPRRVLVLFTDGRNTADAAVTPLQAAELAKSVNVIVHTVGIGGGRGIVPQEFMGQVRYVPIQDEFDEALLKEIAQKTNGRYFHAADADGLKIVMREIDKLEKREFEQPRYMEYQEYSSIFMALGFIVLLIAIAMDRTLLLRLP